MTTSSVTATNTQSLAVNRLIRASAGTGKTFQLANQYIARLRQTPHPDRILASTFTKKAASEILERILKTLAEAALDRSALKRLSSHLPGPAIKQAECLDLLARLTRNLHRVRISTLDSFFIQLAQSFSLELGLPPGWRIIDDLEQDQLRTAALEQLLADQQQSEVVRLMHLLAKGDAGRGVTSLLRRAIDEFYLAYRETSQPAWQRVPQPTPVASEELQRVNDFLNVHADRLREQRPTWTNWHKSLDATLDAIDSEDWDGYLGITLVQKILEGESKYDRQSIPDDVREAYEVLNRHAAAMVLRQLGDQTNGTWELLDRFHTILAGRLEEAHASTFSEVARALSQRVKDIRPDLLEYRLDAGIEHLLLDEFQDTSLLQWSVLRPLAQRATQGEGRSFFCVGDPKQSIYGWRGGVSALFDALSEQLGSLTEASLTCSFRSSQPVIDVVNTVFRRIGNHPNLGEAADTVHRWSKQFTEHSTNWPESQRPGYVTLEGGPSAEPDEHLSFIARRIGELHTAAPKATIAVLTRTNATVAKVARMLRWCGIPASEEGGNAPTDCLAVRLILTLVQLADHPGDTAAAFAIQHSPLAASLGLTANSTDEDIDRLAAGLRRRLAEEGYGRCIEEWARVLAPVCDPRGLARLKQLVDLAQSYDAHATLRPRDFVQSVEVQRLEQPTAAPVRVMTVHQSKGLQFDIVVLPELDCHLVPRTPSFAAGAASPVEPWDTVIRYRNKTIQDLLPSELQRVFLNGHSSVVEGSLCLMYVALTRAIHAMHMLVPPTRANEKTMSLQYDNLIRVGLIDGKPISPDSVPYRHGNPDWLSHVPHLTATPDLLDAAVATPPELAPLEIRFATTAAENLDGAERVTPSQSRSTTGMPLRQLIRPGDTAALTRGSLIHAWLEHLEWLDESSLSDSELRRIALPLGASETSLDESIHEFRRMLATTGTATLLNRSTYSTPENLPFVEEIKEELTAAGFDLTVRNERKFSVPSEGRLIGGTIDRLVLFHRNGTVVAADILDYKTDVLDGIAREQLQSRMEHYHDQLKLYREAVSHLYRLPGERVAARLILLGTGTIEAV